MHYPYTGATRQDFSRLMTVTGEASLSVEPDTATIQLEVMTENELLSQAQQENAYKMTQVIQALVQAGILRENIQTTAYNIHPMYDFVDGKQVFRTYQVTNSVTVKISNVDQAGRIIDVAVQNGVNRVSNIQFTLENPEGFYRQALSNALQDAVEKAQTIAETLQVSVDVTPVKVVEELNETPRTFKTFAAMGESMSTPIEPGQILIQARVEAQFRY